MIIVPTEPWHFTLMEPREYEKSIMEAFGDFSPVAQIYAANSVAFTGLTDDREIIAVGGLFPIWKGVAEAWIFTSPLFEKNMIRGIKAIKFFMDATIKELKLHRVQAAVKTDYNKAKRLASFLDFQYEGPMYKYGLNGEDYSRFARII